MTRADQNGRGHATFYATFNTALQESLYLARCEWDIVSTLEAIEYTLQTFLSSRSLGPCV